MSLELQLLPSLRWEYNELFLGHILITIDVALLTNKAFTDFRETDRSEDWQIHSIFCKLAWEQQQQFVLPSFRRAMSSSESVKFSWTITLLTLICLLYTTNIYEPYIVTPFWLPSFPPVVKPKHDWEGVRGQHFTVVFIKKTMSCCQRKSVANLGTEWKILSINLESKWK